MLIALLVAFPLGMLSAARRNTAADGAGTAFALLGICMPNFLVALLLIFLFGVTLRWLPVSGYTDPLRGPGERPPLADAARDHPRARAGSRAHADAALEPHRGALRGLRAHRAGQGAVRARDPRPARAQERPHPGRHRDGAPARRAHRGRGDHGVRVRPPRRRPARGRRGLRAGLSPGAGGRPPDRRGLHPEQPGRWTSSTRGSTRGFDIAEHAPASARAWVPPRGRPRCDAGWRCGGWSAGGSPSPAPR